MRKKWILSIILIILSINIFGKDRDYSYLGEIKNGLALAKLKGENSKYGYINITGKVIIPFKYDEATEFKNGTAVVGISKKYYLIDKIGKNVINDSFEEIGDSCYEVRSIKKNGKYGFINNAGKILIYPQYSSIDNFENEFTIVNKNEVIDKTGKKIANYTAIWHKNNMYKICKNKKYGFMNEKGEVIAEPQYDEVTDFFQGKALVKKNNNYFVIDEKGGKLYEIKTKYMNEIMFYINGKLILSHIPSENRKNEGLIDWSGNIIIPPKYYEIKEFNEGYAVVRYDYKYGLINEKGKEIIPLKYKELSYIGEGIYVYSTNNELYGYMDKDLKKITKEIYSGVSIFSEGYSQIKKGNKVGYIDKNGKEYWIGTIEEEYESSDDIEE